MRGTTEQAMERKEESLQLIHMGNNPVYIFTNNLGASQSFENESHGDKPCEDYWTICK